MIVVDKVADAASGTFGVRLETPDPGNRVPGCLKCKVRIGEGDADTPPPRRRGNQR